MTAWDAISNGRNIPAHAGKTMPYEPLIPAPEEHPRACGENVQIP